MDEKIYVNKTITIGCLTNIDIDTAVNEIRFRNPQGTTGTFTEAIEIVDKRRIRVKTRLPLAGKWTVWAHTVLVNGDDHLSTPYSFTVYEEGK